MNTRFELNITKLNVRANEKYLYLAVNKVELKIAFEDIKKSAKYIIGLIKKTQK